MRILLINPPYHSLTSLYGVGAQTPLGLLWIGGALIDEGHDVRLLDAEALRLSAEDIVPRTVDLRPDVIMTGHAGSTPAHPSVIAMSRKLKGALPAVLIIYGGVFPTYHAQEILSKEPSIDMIVRGEGEQTIVNLAEALASGAGPAGIRGVTYRKGRDVRANAPAEMIANLDAHRVGWELIEDWDLYRCWGMARSAIVQFSRGCPHQCTYCGQRGFWTKWRYRDVSKTVTEIASLYRENGVRFVDLADENPTSSKRIWQSFLEAMIAENVPVKLFATIRAPDIVRDADILHLYKHAGIECVLMGMETTDQETMVKIRKGSTTRDDLEAIRLLRQHGILSMVGHIVGFEQETLQDYWRSLKQLIFYDPDLLNAMYVTPHRWTGFYKENEAREIVEPDQARWDYRHQILATRHLKPWQIFTAIKLTEAILHIRPRVLWRLLFDRDSDRRRAYRWCFRYAGRVWLEEIREFLSGGRITASRTLSEHAGEALAEEAPLLPVGATRSPFHRFQSGNVTVRQSPRYTSPEKSCSVSNEFTFRN